jgi:hypothetical protein
VRALGPARTCRKKKTFFCREATDVEEKEGTDPPRGPQNAGNAKYVPGKRKSRRPSGTVTTLTAHGTSSGRHRQPQAPAHIAVVDLFPSPRVFVPFGLAPSQRVIQCGVDDCDV